jgi:hypothetical protein
MKLYEAKERLDIKKSDVSGSAFSNVNISGATFENVNISGASFDDVNMSGWRVHDANLSGLRVSKANLAGATISESRLEGMTIDGIAVTEMLAAWRAAQDIPQRCKAAGRQRSVYSVADRKKIPVECVVKPL